MMTEPGILNRLLPAVKPDFNRWITCILAASTQLIVRYVVKIFTRRGE